MAHTAADTTFMVHLEVKECAEHAAAHRHLNTHVIGHDAYLMLAPQVLTEFVHIVTDKRRFQRPLTITSALARADFWWRAREVAHAFPTAQAVSLFRRWMHQHQLGRERLLDTMLAATYHMAGADQIVTTNARDFSVFGCFHVVTP